LDDDSEFLREGGQLISQMLLEVEVEQQVGAGKHERTPEGSNYRNGYREILGVAVAPSEGETTLGEVFKIQLSRLINNRH
jgi:transposase-like protein